MSITLNVPYAEKEQAKALGAKWDAARRVWYIPDNLVASPFARWLPSGAQVAGPADRTKTGPSRSAKKPAAKNTSAHQPRRIDTSGGEPVVGAEYFDTGHDCIPWVHCDQCAQAIAQRKLDLLRQAEPKNNETD